MENVLKNMLIKIYFSRLHRMAFHNLCKTKKPPEGIGATLGLDLKFCIQADRPPDHLKESMQRFRDDVRKRYEFAGKDSHQVPRKIYIKSKWVPPKADTRIEHRMDKFKERLRCELNFLRRVTRRNSSNLSIVQQNHLKRLRSNRDFVILAADKNLGPAIIERDTYINNILTEHLKQPDTYTRLEEQAAKDMIKSIKNDAWDLVLNRRATMDKNEFKYFQQALLHREHRVPQFYGTPKVHKNRTPVPFRPVVSQCGSAAAIISTYIDYKLQPITRTTPSYVKDSEALLDEIDKIKKVPATARIFTSDATSMYTNIDPAEGIPVLRKYLEEFGNEIDEKKHGKIDIDLICDLTEIVMTRNVFQFGSTWWHQKTGTAMGTPCACAYAIIFFGYFERKYIMTKYKNNFILYRRQIDDIFGVWIEDENKPGAFEEFKNNINSFTKLEWNTENLSKKVDFLDLTIWLDKENNTIQYKTYQKPSSLFLYIPAHSAHPPGVLKSIAHGLITTYKRQNTCKKDFKNQVRLLYNRLVSRGYDENELRTLFLEVATKIEQPRSNKQLDRTTTDLETTARNGKQLFFHTQFHPKSFSRSFIQQTYKEECENKDIMGESFLSITNGESGGTMKISKLTIAYSRPKNLREILSPSKLQEYNDCKVEHFL